MGAWLVQIGWFHERARLLSDLKLVFGCLGEMRLIMKNGWLRSEAL